MSAGCARRVMRKHILRIFLCFESPDFPDIFSCSSSARKKHMACSKKYNAYIPLTVCAVVIYRKA